MPTPPRRVQHPPFITVCPINTREGLDAAMATPEKTAALLNAIVRALGVGRVCTHADGDAMAGLLLGEPLLNWEHLYLLTATLVHRGDNGLEPARVAICSHPDTDADTLVYALWQAPTATLAAVSRATSRLIPNAIDWERRRYGRTGGRHFQPLTSASQNRVTATASRWEKLTAKDHALRSFITGGSFLFTDQRTMFAAARGVTATPGRS